MGFRRKKKPLNGNLSSGVFFFFGEMSSGLSDLVGPLNNLLKLKKKKKKLLTK